MAVSGAPFPPPVRYELGGWELLWAELEVGPGPAPALAELRATAAARARSAAPAQSLSAHPTAAAVRRLFREAGCDPTRYRPSSEALLRRLLKGEELPAIHPLVDVNNAFSVELMVPACVMARGSVTPPFVLRRGRPGEAMLSLRGQFDLAGKPLLADEAGPFGTPITDSERVRVGADTRAAWFVAYLPAGALPAPRPEQLLRELIAASGVVRLGAAARGGAAA